MTQIKLNYNTSKCKETTTFQWLDGNLEILSVEGFEVGYGKYSSLNPEDDVLIDDEDLNLVQMYLSHCDKTFLDAAKKLNATIHLQKEIWYECEPAITARWIEFNGCEMLRESTKTQFHVNFIKETIFA